VESDVFMKKKVLMKALCVLMVCLHVFAGGVAVHAYDGGTCCETSSLSPHNIGSSKTGDD